MLSPHEIATLMVLASTPGGLERELAEIRSLLGRGLVQLDATASEATRVLLSVRGREVVARLAAVFPAPGFGI
ncbi:hypothetical protein WS63_18755 [Burkholderia stagnalis]|uniref:MarR family transcriptional regulator n=1 Tax=Burkholderia stagnalis TaxID=1503054 RepID=A0ABX9YPP0_9BURK|nr:hypothetical protein [Burkholderia stagnalis]KVC59133.1 hypothetical protein WS59_21785 [Burkholderia stagnalis]KVD87135.1 hypothetical protein WS63_18755 [Burkholderia stagnalis]KVN21981.1 hypothetical protein WT10_11630 [Burkholderia stagnalis]KVO57017.1 hypothetical protein WT18_19200 [Burkholderia stagnalis]KVP11300.1 hypothetical protein WT20_14625 [Burkholderia stagnalis]